MNRSINAMQSGSSAMTTSTPWSRKNASLPPKVLFSPITTRGMPTEQSCHCTSCMGSRSYRARCPDRFSVVRPCATHPSHHAQSGRPAGPVGCDHATLLCPPRARTEPMGQPPEVKSRFGLIISNFQKLFITITQHCVSSLFWLPHRRGVIRQFFIARLIGSG